MSIFGELESFINSHVWPFLKNIGKSVVQGEINALVPLASQAVGEAEQAVVTAAASGSTGSLGSALSAIVVATATKAETAGIAAGATAILASVGTALANNTATQNKLAPAPKPAS